MDTNQPSFPPKKEMFAQAPPCPEGTNTHLFRYFMKQEYLCTSLTDISPRKII